MSRCEHGQKITKFCVTEHCHHKEAGGCDYCIKKYHFHLTNTVLLNEGDLQQLIRSLTVASDCKYKSRSLLQLASDYLRAVKATFSSWFDAAQTAVQQRLTNPILRKQGLLPPYQRLRNKEYRKVNAKELKALSDFSKVTPPDLLKKQELQAYFSEVEWLGSLLDAADSLSVQLAKLLSPKDVADPLPQRSPKLMETYDSILRERQRYGLQLKNPDRESIRMQLQPPKEEIIMASSLMKNRLGRESSQKEKSSTPNKDSTEGINKKTNEAENISKTTQPQPQLSQNPNQEETRQERAKRLRRRRSSIDDRIMDMKFGQDKQKEKQKQKDKIVDKIKEDSQLKKKLILENVFSSKSSNKQAPSQTTEAKQQIKIQVKQSKNEQKYRKMSTGSKKQVKQGGLPFQFENIIKRNTSFLPEKRDYQDDRSQRSSNKTSQNNLFQALLQKGINMADLINSIIPAPPIQQRNQLETVTNKIVHIPISIPQNKGYEDEIKSPIFKNKRKMQKQNATGGIQLQIVDCQKQQEPLSTVKEQFKQQTERELSGPVLRKQPSQKQEQLIVLQHNEKNSLLLFSESLKSDSQKAIQLLKAALKYSPNNLSAAQYLSFLYLENDRAKQCLQVCESILLKIQDKTEQFEVTIHLHNNRAAALNMLGRYSESIVVLQKCLKFRRKHYFYKNLADAYFSLGIPEKAIMNYEKAIRLDPGYDQAFYNLAVTQFLQEQYSSAMLNIEQATKIDCVNPVYKELASQIAKRIENIVK